MCIADAAQGDNIQDVRDRILGSLRSLPAFHDGQPAVSGTGEASSTVAVEPLMEISGVRSSWLTMARNLARCRSLPMPHKLTLDF